MDRTRLEIFPGLWLDHRRCAYLERERILAVADLHLGYAWAHRFQGQMMPLQPDGVRERLLELCSFYKPGSIAVLGDIVHQAVPITAIKDDLLALLNSLREHCGVKLILGNHDRGLKRLTSNIEFSESIDTGRFLLIHGNEKLANPGDRFTLMGHEHPAIALGDGVRSGKFPCFLVSENLCVLPAFSRWAAGSEIRSYSFMSPIARAARFQKAIAILNGKLLPVPIESRLKTLSNR